ncbi:MAG: NADH-quinone oxidoreductase subunit 5 family protein, partial [Chloroflexota bacterium]
MWSRTGTFVITDIQNLALSHQISGFTVALFAILVFAGAAGKSAQFPLHIWLPDAMEGPTPISALIHAATMVAAGVYLVARLFPVYSTSTEALHTVAIVGAVTAVVGGLIGLVMTDIKRVLAYSTISQLGYMMLGLGTGGYVAGIFHLFTHAFFKSLLFLGAGSVGHSSHTFDMRKMGGLRRYQPITFWTFVIASLALSGIFPFAGFWSKDEVLSSAFNFNVVLWVAGFITVFLTAFYIFRAVFMTFFGEYRGGDPPEIGGGGGPMLLHAQQEEERERGPLSLEEAEERSRGENWPSGHPHESPWWMLVPMMILALFAIGAGFVNITGAFGDLIKGALPVSMRGIDQETTNWGLLLGALAFAFCGVGAAAVVYY